MSITVGTVSSGGAGSVGPAGPQGDPGPAGAGFTNRGAWSTANAYAARDVVTWQGSAFVALNAVAAGGANPRADAANWLVWAQGGGEIAYAEYTAGTIVGPAVAATLFDIPGLSIPVPAGTGRHTVEAACVGQINWTSAAVAADSTVFRLVITDEAGLWVTQSLFKLPSAVPSTGPLFHFRAKRSVAAPAAAKTYKASLYIDSVTHLTTAVYSTASPGGTGWPYGLPAWIQATAL